MPQRIRLSFMDVVMGKSGARVQLRAFYRRVIAAVRGKVKARTLG
jgi:hypothetical protein